MSDTPVESTPAPIYKSTIENGGMEVHRVRYLVR